MSNFGFSVARKAWVAGLMGAIAPVVLDYVQGVETMTLEGVGKAALVGALTFFAAWAPSNR